MPSTLIRRATHAVGVCDHAGWAVLVTASHQGELIDRRRVVLLESGLPTMPYHHEAQRLPLADAEPLIETVRLSAVHHAREALATLAASVSVPIHAIALRVCPPLPDTIAERIANYRAMCVADWVVYRQCLAHAAAERGWATHWYNSKHVMAQAAAALGLDSLDSVFRAAAAIAGRPWQADHKLALAAAIAATAD